ncbi:MAG: hypothetical protein KAS39_01795 [Actinomycetia bacterium]|nr:hypothetical protein [Actinomycetes bacterium]
MAAKIRIAVTGYQITKDVNREKWDLIAGIYNFVNTLQKTLPRSANLILVHGCSTAFDLWAGEAALDLGLGLDLYLPFPRIIQIVKHKLNPIQAESLNRQIYEAERVSIVSNTFHEFAYPKNAKEVVNGCNMAATYGNNKKIKDFRKYCIFRHKPLIDLKEYCNEVSLDNIHLTGGIL